MAGIPVHHTAVDSSATWDKSKVTATGKAELRYVNAWVDSSADANLIGSYRFPHHYKDGGPAILAGVNNAKARLSQAKIPSGDVAGVTAHLNAHQADAKQSILQTIKGWFDYWFADNEDREVKEQAISMPNIYQLVGMALSQGNQDGSYVGLVDVYLDNGAMFAVLSKDGLLYRTDVTLVGGNVTLGELAQVVIDYKPVTQTIKTTRQANGQYRWFAFPAATAVLNRSGELDSRQLFENFVQRIEDGQPYPFLTFYHVGEQITLGQADYVAVDGYTLLISGLWAEDALSQATRQAIEKSPDYYGISIGYMYQPETKEQMQVGEGITIPVYTDGILIECSILAEKDAACLMTGAYTEGVNRMNKKAKDELDKIVAGDPALETLAADLENKVDQVNASTEGLIRREGTEVATTEPETPVADPVVETPTEVAPVETPAPVVEPPTPAEFVLDELAMQTIVERVAATFTDKMTANEQAITDLNGQITALVARIAALEKPLEETVKQVIADLPRKSTTVTYRPTQQHQAEQPEDEEVTSEEIAQATLANLK
jgi:hypothetical protein